jgi:hypothetical protein
MTAMDGDVLAVLGKSLFFIDMSNPDQPTVLSHVPMSGWIPRALVARDHVFIAVNEVFTTGGEHKNSLVVVDAMNPEAPQLLTELEVPGAWQGYGWSGARDMGSTIQGFAVTNYTTTMWSVGIDAPSQPAIARHVTFDQEGLPSFSGPWAFAALPSRLVMMDLAKSSTPPAEVSIQARLMDPDVDGEVLRAHTGSDVVSYQVPVGGPAQALGSIDTGVSCPFALVSVKYAGPSGLGLIARDILASESSGGMCDGLPTRYPDRVVGVDMADPAHPSVGSPIQLGFEASDALMLGSKTLLAGRNGSVENHAALLSLGTAPSILAATSLDIAPDGLKVIDSLQLAVASGWQTDPNAPMQIIRGFVQLIDLGEASLTKRGLLQFSSDMVDVRQIGERLVIVTGSEIASVDIGDRDHPVVVSAVTPGAN